MMFEKDTVFEINKERGVFVPMPLTDRQVDLRTYSLNKALEAKMSGLDNDDVLVVAEKYYNYVMGIK